MPNLVIVAHTPLAGALRQVARHVYPDAAPRIHALDVAPDDDPLAVETALRAMVGDCGGEVLILADVFGATPCNVAQRVSDGTGVRMVVGVNVPMLWRTACYLDEPLDSLAQRAASGGSNGIMQVASRRPQNQAGTATGHDQDTRHHHQ